MPRTWNFGAIVCQPDSNDRGYDATGLEPGDKKLESDLSPHVSFVRNQFSTNTSCGHAFAAAIDIVTEQSEYVHGLRPASALFLYHIAIRLAKMRISDSGIDIRAVAAVLKRLGCCDDAVWPFDVDKIRTMPPFEAIWDATKRSGCSYAFVRETGDDRLGKLARALNAGCPVVVGLDIDEAFFGYDGTSVLQPPGGETSGRQFVVLIGRDLTRTRFKALCCFGSNWGAGGYCWLSDAYVGSASCWDACILHGFDAVREQLTIREAIEMMTRSRTR